MGGIFFVFSDSLMRALRQLPPPQGLAAMQSINRAIVTPLFGLLLMGTALLSAVLTVAAAVRLDEPDAPAILAGGLLYVLGAMVLTIVYHVPRNNALDRVDAASHEANDRWVGYASGWTAWNHVRAVASLGAAVLFVAALS